MREATRTIKETILDALPARIRNEAARLENRFNKEFSITTSDDGSTAVELAVAQAVSRIAFGLELVLPSRVLEQFEASYSVGDDHHVSEAEIISAKLTCVARRRQACGDGRSSLASPRPGMRLAQR